MKKSIIVIFVLFLLGGMASVATASSASINAEQGAQIPCGLELPLSEDNATTAISMYFDAINH